jgi:hypothetical protein
VVSNNLLSYRYPADGYGNVRWRLDAVKWHCEALLLASTFCTLAEVIRRVALREAKTKEAQGLGLGAMASDHGANDRGKGGVGETQTMELRPLASSLEADGRRQDNDVEMQTSELRSVESSHDGLGREQDDAGEMLPVLQEAATLQSQLEGMLQKLEVASHFGLVPEEHARLSEVVLMNAGRMQVPECSASFPTSCRALKLQGLWDQGPTVVISMCGCRCISCSGV